MLPVQDSIFQGHSLSFSPVESSLRLRVRRQHFVLVLEVTLLDCIHAVSTLWSCLMFK